MSVEKHLAKFGVTVQQAKDFINSNAQQPENIFDIARDELKNNADEYVLDTNVKYYTLKLAYIRVNNRTDMQKYSYIPAWSLELLQKDTTNACPVFINAIDGSVIHPDDLS